jgi:hypothetical protein
LLDEAGASEPLKAEVEVENKVFGTRLEAAKYLDQLLSVAKIPQVERDAGLWAWLTLFYFDQLSPPRKGGIRKTGELARYVPALGNFQRFYRHLLLGPYLILRAHADELHRAAAVLATAPNAPGDVVEQFASRQELITNRAVMSVVTKLYVDPASSKLKRGSGSKGGGSPRRFADVLNQFDLTYDLYAVGEPQLLALLPSEFDRFRK